MAEPLDIRKEAVRNISVQDQGVPVELARSDRRLTCRTTAEPLDMRKEAVRNISVQDPGMRKLTATLVSRNLTEEQKD
jgi:hypothetical protein